MNRMVAIGLVAVALQAGLAVPASAAVSGGYDKGRLIICARGADTFVAASGTNEDGANLAFGLRDGECHVTKVPGGRYLVQVQGGNPPACSGALSNGNCEVARPPFSHTLVTSSNQSSYGRFDEPSVDVNVAKKGTTKVEFVFNGYHI
jgi:hypothetical protein